MYEYEEDEDLTQEEIELVYGDSVKDELDEEDIFSEAKESFDDNTLDKLLKRGCCGEKLDKFRSNTKKKADQLLKYKQKKRNDEILATIRREQPYE
jgi:hypothetical protein